MRLNRVLLNAGIIAATALAFGATPAAATDEVTCEEHTVNVALTPSAAASYTISGTLCSPGKTKNKTVQLLVHGILVDRDFWDFQYKPERYSYQEDALDAGYATFNVDRIGSGASSRPPADQVTLDVNAYVLHQVTVALRAGALGGPLGSEHFKRVVLVTWAYSGAIGVAYASQFPTDVDALVLAGFLHDLTPEVITLLTTKIYPANTDPYFAGQGVPDNYFTLLPGERAGILYTPGEVKPAVATFEEAYNKGTVTLGELNDVGRIYGTDSLGVHVPTYIIVGDHDKVFCNNAIDCSTKASVKAFEAPFYSADACIEVDVVHNTGHGITTGLPARKVFRKILDWTDSYAGVKSNQSPASRCGCH